MPWVTDEYSIDTARDFIKKNLCNQKNQSNLYSKLIAIKNIKMKNSPISKYILTQITDEAISLKYCDWLEELDDIVFENDAEEAKKFAYLDK